MLEGGFCSKKLINIYNTLSLNPYYAGRWFLLYYEGLYNPFDVNVLILIMLEGGFCF